MYKAHILYVINMIQVTVNKQMFNVSQARVRELVRDSKLYRK